MSNDYGKLASAFNQFKSENDLTSLSFAESRGYGWRIGTEVKALLQPSLDDEEGFEDYIKEEFRNQFEEGHDMFGIPIIGTIAGKHSRNLYLYNISKKDLVSVLEEEKELDSDTPGYDSKMNIIFGVKQTLFKQMRVKDPITNAMFYWPYAMQPESMYIKEYKESLGEHYPYQDSMTDRNSGSFILSLKKDNSYAFDESEIYKIINGKIDYRTGLLTLSRDLKSSNAATAIDILPKYNAMLEAINAASGGGEDGGGSDSGGSGESGGASIDIDVSGYEPAEYEYEKMTAVLTSYESPVKVVWTYTLPDE